MICCSFVNNFSITYPWLMYDNHCLHRMLRSCHGGIMATRSLPWLIEPSWWTTTHGTILTSLVWVRPWPVQRTRLMRSCESWTLTMCWSSLGDSLVTHQMVRECEHAFDANWVWNWYSMRKVPELCSVSFAILWCVFIAISDFNTYVT